MDNDIPPSPDRVKAPESYQPVRHASDSAEELRRDTQDGFNGLVVFRKELDPSLLLDAESEN